MSELVINLMLMSGLERLYLCEQEEDGTYIISGLSKQMEIGATLAAHTFNNSNRFAVLEILERRDPKGDWSDYPDPEELKNAFFQVRCKHIPAIVQESLND